LSPSQRQSTSIARPTAVPRRMAKVLMAFSAARRG
jgi:hypothetical protein